MTTSKPRLAIFTSSMKGGGAQRSMLNVARWISERGYNVDLVLARAEGPFLADVPESVRVVDLKASRVLASLPALIRYLRRDRPVAMLSALGHVNIVAILARRLARVNTRLIVSERNTMSELAPRASRRRARLMPWLAKKFYPWADGIVAVSQGVGDDLEQFVDTNGTPIHVIYNPVVRPELHDLARLPLDHPWFRPGEPPVVLGVGRLNPQKDFGTLIRAFAKVAQTRDVRLLILGEGAQRDELESQVKDLKLEQQVSLPGFARDVYAYMSRASLFVLSSRWEGLPGVLIEAMCCGAPVISTDCPSGPREILADGKYGDLVPMGDADALACAIGSSLDSRSSGPPRESWRPFEPETVVSQYIDVLLGNS